MLKKIRYKHTKILSLILLSLIFVACRGENSNSSSGSGSSSFSVESIDGYIVGSSLIDANGEQAKENTTNPGEYIFLKTPTGEFNDRGGRFSESNITNYMNLKAPALSKVISPITTLLLDFPTLVDNLTVALGVIEEQLRGNFLEADDLNIAKLAQIIYGMYVNNLSNEFATSLDSSTPASLDDIFSIAKSVTSSSSILRKTDLLEFLEATQNYIGTVEGLEDGIKNQKQKAQSNSSFEVSLIDGYISEARVSDANSKIAKENQSKFGYYDFRATPFGELSANGGFFIESNVSNFMSLKAPALSRVISPITTLLLDFPNLSSTLQIALDVNETQLIGNFLESNDLDIAKLAQVVYISYVVDIADDINNSLTTTPPLNLDELIENIALEVDKNIIDNNVRANTLLFLDKIKTYSSNTSELEAFIAPYKTAVQNKTPSLVSYWAKTYGSSYDSQPNFIIQTRDGRYVFGGILGTPNGHSAWVTKLDSIGNIIWQKLYNAKGYNDASAKSILEKDNGDLIVLGIESHFFWFLELDGADGSIKFQKSYKEAPKIDIDWYSDKTTFDMTSIIPTGDDGYVFIGTQLGYHAPYIDNKLYRMDWIIALKVNANGGVEWSRNIRNITPTLMVQWGDLYAHNAFATKDGGYLVVGSSVGRGRGIHTSKFHLLTVLKLASDGQLQWLKNYGGSKVADGYMGFQLHDGNYLIAGRGENVSTFGGNTVWAIKIDTKGGILWQKSYGKDSSSQAYAITKGNDGKIVVIGKGKSSIDQSRYNIWAFKIYEKNGNITLEQEEYGGFVSGDSIGLSVANTNDGGYVIAGVTNSFKKDDKDSNSDIWVLKLDSSLGVVFNLDSRAFAKKMMMFFEDTKTGVGYVTTSTTNEKRIIADHSLNAKNTDVVPNTQSG